MENLSLHYYKTSLLMLMLTFFTSPLAAQDAYIYAPIGCDFTAAFPDQPSSKQKCPSDPSAPCFESVRYTSRAGFDQNINVEMSCIPLDGGLYQTYDQETLTGIIAGILAKDNLPEVPIISFEEKDNFKIAAASGVKKSGFSDKIYMTQIWVTEDSLLSIEGEMSLSSDQNADKEFADILRSVKLKE